MASVTLIITSGITIGSAMSKLFNLILLERLKKRIDRTHPVSVNQTGFKKGHRTADLIFVLKTIVNKIVKIERNELFCAFIDFLKLQRIGIGGLFYRNIKSMYNSVLYHNGVLDPIASTLGLRQGGVLSPFNLFIDDINDVFDETCDPVLALGKTSSALCQ